MTLHEVTLADFRSHELFKAPIHPHTTIIIGPNGTGKTSILEAIYLLYRGTSFRGRDRDVVAHHMTHTETKAEFDNGETRRAKIDTTGEKITKQFTVADKTSARLTPAQKLSIVLFEPDELRLLTSSPQRRRDFIDGIIGRLSPTYSAVLSRYSRTLAQRNELLKQYERMHHDTWESHLFPWDIKLAELGASIVKARRNFLEHANGHLSRLYSDLAGAPHDVKAEYSLAETPSQQSLLASLQRSHQADALRGYTAIGPHRDDFTISLDAHPASETASRGELRTIMLAFKLLEVELQEHHSGEKPLILLDDVFSELDISREQKLMEALRNYQTIITATDLRDELKINASIVTLKQ